VAGRVGDDDHELSAFRGLSRRRPVLALTFTLFLLAQAGVPFTSGFWAKAGVISAAVSTKDGYGYSVAIVAMLCAAIAAFLYLRIVKTMYFDDADESGAGAPAPAVPVSAGLGLALAAAFTLAVGVAPGFAVDLARQAIPTLAR
jgi:NADH-quinone oxidoreductase subunit N